MKMNIMKMKVCLFQILIFIKIEYIEKNFVYLESGMQNQPAINPSPNRPQVRSESIVGK